MKDLTACILTVAKDEDNFIDEWVNYHLNLGFDKIYIVDNNDEDKPLSYKHDKVEIIRYAKPLGDYWGLSTLNDAINFGLEYIKKDKFDYCAYIDVDEFIELRKHDNIKDFIYEDAELTGNNISEIIWEYYDDNDIIFEKDVKSVLESYTRKSIVYTDVMRKCIFKVFDETNFIHGPHCPNKNLFNHENALYYTNHTKENIAVLRHYRTKCLETYLKHKVKMTNFGKSWENGFCNNIIDAFFRLNIVTLDKIKAFPDLLKKYDINI